MSSINAVRGDIRKEFTKEVWNDMPKDKYGWQLETEEPDEVKRLRLEKEQAASQDSDHVLSTFAQNEMLLQINSLQERNDYLADQNEQISKNSNALQEQSVAQQRENNNLKDDLFKLRAAYDDLLAKHEKAAPAPPVKDETKPSPKSK